MLNHHSFQAVRECTARLTFIYRAEESNFSEAGLCLPDILFRGNQLSDCCSGRAAHCQTHSRTTQFNTGEIMANLAISIRLKSTQVFSCGLLLACCLSFTGFAAAQDEISDELRTALGFKPVQKNSVDYDIPSDEEAKECRLEKIPYGWLVYDSTGRLLRAYRDRNEDRKPDQWSFYKNGVEVYRDLDNNYDGKTDQYRWLGTAGVRWGEDKNQDGKIDSWKAISAEEVSMEVVAAIKRPGDGIFERLLITSAEIKSLGLGKKQQEDVAERVAEARRQFSSFARSQKMVNSSSSWVHFGGIRPGMIPKDTEGSTKDIMIYDSVAAVVDTGRSHGQISIGTLIKVGDVWRIVDLPEVIQEGVAISNGGLFFQASHSTSGGSDATTNTADADANRKLYDEYIQLGESARATRDASRKSRAHQKRAELLFEMSENATDQTNRDNWLRQMSDDLSGAFLNDEYEDGISQLGSYVQKMKSNKVSTETISYATYRRISAYYTRALTAADEDDYQDVEDRYNKALKGFIDDYPKATHIPDAMLQLALTAEFGDDIKEAIEWYGTIAKEHSSSSVARKAAGAQTRLRSEGRVISFSGKTINGSNWQLSDERGKVVVIQFWATWCGPCKEDMEVLSRMNSKYGDDLTIVSVSLDDSKDELVEYLRSNRLPWTQLFEDGGQEGPLAEQLGIATLPTMLLVGKDSKVINRNITSSELDRAINRATE